jgi:Amt family ammonium transporter
MRKKSFMGKMLMLILVVLCIPATIVFGESGAAQSQQAAVTTPAAPKVDSGDTAWVLVSAALVMLMTPGLAFFYGGLVRRKNVLGVLMQCFIILAVLSLQWVLFGYSLSFAPGNGFIGSLKWFALRGVGLSHIRLIRPRFRIRHL